MLLVTLREEKPLNIQLIPFYKICCLLISVNFTLAILCNQFYGAHCLATRNDWILPKGYQDNILFFISLLHSLSLSHSTKYHQPQSLHTYPDMTFSISKKSCMATLSLPPLWLDVLIQSSDNTL